MEKLVRDRDNIQKKKCKYFWLYEEMYSFMYSKRIIS